MIKKKQLVEVAKELNKVLGLEPEINVRQGLEKLKEEVVVAADLLEPEDELSSETLKVIEELKQEDQEDTETEETMEVEETASEPEPEVEKKPEPSKVKSPGKQTKKDVVLEGLKKGTTIEEMAKQIVDAGIDEDYEKNQRVVKAHLRKMGYDVKKATIEKTPVFKSKE